MIGQFIDSPHYDLDDFMSAAYPGVGIRFTKLAKHGLTATADSPAHMTLFQLQYPELFNGGYFINPD